MNIKTTGKKAEEDIKKAAQAAADKLEDGINRNQETVDQTMEAVATKAHRWREDIQPAINTVAERTRDLVDRSQAALAHCRDPVRDRLYQASTWTNDCVASKPLTALALATAIGASLALLFGHRKS